MSCSVKERGKSTKYSSEDRLMQKKSRLLTMSMPTVVSPFNICDLQAVSDSLKATSDTL